MLPALIKKAFLRSVALTPYKSAPPVTCFTQKRKFIKAKNVSNFTPFRVGGPLKRSAIAINARNILNINLLRRKVQRRFEK